MRGGGSKSQNFCFYQILMNLGTKRFSRVLKATQKLFTAYNLPSHPSPPPPDRGVTVWDWVHSWVKGKYYDRGYTGRDTLQHGTIWGLSGYRRTGNASSLNNNNPSVSAARAVTVCTSRCIRDRTFVETSGNHHRGGLGGSQRSPRIAEPRVRIVCV